MAFLATINGIIFIKLLIAMLLGMVIGVERIVAHKTAGMRTYAMVSMGAALFVTISDLTAVKYGAFLGLNPIFIAANVVTAVGFLGAGLIIFKDSRVTGLTTATGLWVAAGIGMACGFGFYMLALMATILALFVFVILWFVEKQIKNIAEDPTATDPVLVKASGETVVEE